MQKINALGSEGQKIRYKVVLALFTMNEDLFNPRSFANVPLELIPRLLELVQQEVGYNGFGKGVFERTNKRRSGEDPTLDRVYQTITEWPSLPLLFVRGAGKLPKKRRQRKRKVADEDEEWAPKSQVSAKTAQSSTAVVNSRGKRAKKKVTSYADVEASDEEDEMVVQEE